MNLGDYKLTQPINKQIKPTQVYNDALTQFSYPSASSLRTSVTNMPHLPSDSGPFGSTQSAFHSLSPYSSDTKVFARPLNVMMQPSSVSLHSSTSHSPFSSAPTSTLGLKSHAFALTPNKDLANDVNYSDFQQFLYAKFRQEYDSRASKQSFYRADIAAPQNLSRLSLGTKETSDRKTFDASPINAKNSSRKGYFTSSLDLKPDQEQKPLKSKFQKQLVEKKPARLVPISPKQGLPKNSSVDSLRQTAFVGNYPKGKLEGNGDSKAKLPRNTEGKSEGKTKKEAKRTDVTGEAVKAKGKKSVAANDVHRERPSGRAREAGRNKEQPNASDPIKPQKADLKLTKAELKASGDKVKSGGNLKVSKTVDPLHALPKRRINPGPIHVKSETREPPKPKPKYTPYSLGDYIKLNKSPIKLGGLGPANIGTEVWHREAKKRQRITEYIKTLKPDDSQDTGGMHTRRST